MPFDPGALLAMEPREVVARHGARDVILYALGIGVGLEDPTGAEALDLAFEQRLQVMPTMASVLAAPGFWQMDPRFGIDWRRLLHAEQSVEVHHPLPIEGELVSRLVVEDIFDRGEARGALMRSRRDIFDRATGDLLATERRGALLRGDGGKGGRTDRPAEPVVAPARQPDHVVVLPTSPNQALLYRLSGDYNPIHVNPAVAAEAGFARPILHGLCTYGVVGRALISSLCAGAPDRLRRLDCRFSAPVYPGETLEVRIWRMSSSQAAFEARVVSRDVTVIKNGYAEIREART